MRDAFHHEALFRGEAALSRIGAVRLAICGAGAVGSNLVDSVVRQGFRRIRVIDDDRVESHNVGTQTYAQSDVGAFKVEILQAEVFRAVGVEIDAVRKRLTERSVARFLADSDLIVDGFDNHASRAIVTSYARERGVPCLHVGLSADYAELLWNDGYRVPSDLAPEEDVCNYAMARNLIAFAVALASESIVRYVLDGAQENLSFTLRDLRINRETD